MIGRQWLIEQVGNLTTEIVQLSPSAFTEEHRVLPASVSPLEGPMRFDVNPFMREIADFFDVNNPGREGTLMKGVQLTATTVLETIILYIAAYLKTVPAQLFTADDILAKIRLDAHILPMFEQSGFGDIFQSPDIKNKRKTGLTGHLLQFRGGGYLIINGAMSPRRFRSVPVMFSLQDELDAWPVIIGKDGNSSKLADDRTSAYEGQRKIFRNSTPLDTTTSATYRHYLRGDRRDPIVLCLGCEFPQKLKWSGENERGERFGMTWESEADGKVAEGSVRYLCKECGKEHFDHDKERLFSPDNGAHWQPTAKPVAKNIVSWHLPSMYSPPGFKTWESCVIDYVDAYDVVGKRVRNMGLYKTFYNNILGWPFDPPGARVSFRAVSAHRRRAYLFGQVPNKYATQVTGGPILFLTMQVDVHKSNLAVVVMGWTRDARCFVINYWRLEDDDCTSIDSKVWVRLQELIDEEMWTSDDGYEYGVACTLIDAGYAPKTVSDFCSQYVSNVYPVIGGSRPAKFQKIQEFAEFEMKAGTKGYRLIVDHYKDRIAPVLRRSWDEQDGEIQKRYHFNAPMDATDKQLKELTVEKLTEVTDEKGNVVFEWKRPGNVPNELWDLLVYGHAGLDILAWLLCRGYYQLETINWDVFWAHFEQELKAE